jgi:hypothetical protein
MVGSGFNSLKENPIKICKWKIIAILAISNQNTTSILFSK